MSPHSLGVRKSEYLKKQNYSKGLNSFQGAELSANLISNCQKTSLFPRQFTFCTSMHLQLPVAQSNHLENGIPSEVIKQIIIRNC